MNHILCFVSQVISILQNYERQTMSFKFVQTAANQDTTWDCLAESEKNMRHCGIGGILISKPSKALRTKCKTLAKGKRTYGTSWFTVLVENDSTLKTSITTVFNIANGQENHSLMTIQPSKPCDEHVKPCVCSGILKNKTNKKSYILFVRENTQ